MQNTYSPFQAELIKQVEVTINSVRRKVATLEEELERCRQEELEARGVLQFLKSGQAPVAAGAEEKSKRRMTSHSEYEDAILSLADGQHGIYGPGTFVAGDLSELVGASRDACNAKLKSGSLPVKQVRQGGPGEGNISVWKVTL